MIHQLSGGAWGVVTRRVCRRGVARAAGPDRSSFCRCFWACHHLYEWTHHDVVDADPILRHKARYLNTPFFLVRAALYFAVWNAIAYFLNRWSLEQDRSRRPAHRPAHADAERRRPRGLRA